VPPGVAPCYPKAGAAYFDVRLMKINTLSMSFQNGSYMKRIIVILITICSLSMAENSCRQPYKYHLGASPFFANRNMIDSMLDVNGEFVSYEYDNIGRVIKVKSPTNGISEYAYQTNYRYSSLDPISGLVIEYYDNEDAGTDSMIFSNGTGYIMRNVIRFNLNKDVFENWRDRADIEPKLYDSIEYLINDSLFHYRSIIYGQDKYEYYEGCKSNGNICNCNEIFRTSNYPIAILSGPIYEYNNDKLMNRKGAAIYYKNEPQLSSTILSSSSEEMQLSSSSMETTTKLTSHRDSNSIKYKHNEYYLNGRTVNN